MADNTSLILAALAFLILYVLIHVRKDRFLMHMLSRAAGAPPKKAAVKAARKPTRKPAKKKRKARRR